MLNVPNLLVFYNTETLGTSRQHLDLRRRHNVDDTASRHCAGVSQKIHNKIYSVRSSKNRVSATEGRMSAFWRGSEKGSQLGSEMIGTREPCPRTTRMLLPFANLCGEINRARRHVVQLLPAKTMHLRDHELQVDYIRYGIIHHLNVDIRQCQWWGGGMLRCGEPGGQ